RIALQATDDERAERDVVGQDREHPLDRLLELQVLRDLPPELSFQAHRRPLRSPAACHTGEGCKYVTEKPVYFTDCRPLGGRCGPWSPPPGCGTHARCRAAGCCVGETAPRSAPPRRRRRARAPDRRAAR